MYPLYYAFWSKSLLSLCVCVLSGVSYKPQWHQAFLLFPKGWNYKLAAPHSALGCVFIIYWLLIGYLLLFYGYSP